MRHVILVSWFCVKLIAILLVVHTYLQHSLRNCVDHLAALPT